MPHCADLVSLYKRLIGQLVQILLGDGFDTGLTTQLFIVFQLNIVVFGIKDDKLIVPIDINDGNEVWDKCILGLLNKRFAVRCSPRPLRFINQVNEFLKMCIRDRYFGSFKHICESTYM